MGNDMDYGGGHPFFGYGYGINRSGWKPVSDGALRRLEEAKRSFHEFVKSHSFANIDDDDYKFTKKQAIKLHLVGKLRPKFNNYVKRFGAKPKWNKLSDKEKRAISKYKNRVSAVYFCDITIDNKVRNKLFELEPKVFDDELLITEISLFTHLVSLGIPEIDSLGWIMEIPRNQKIEKIPKIPNLSQFLDKEQGKRNIIFIETTNEYKEKNPSKRNMKKSSSSSSVNKTRTRARSPLKVSNKNTLYDDSSRSQSKASIVSNSGIKQRKKLSFFQRQKNVNSNSNSNKSKKRHIVDLCSDDDEEWTPNSNNKRKRCRSSPNKRRKLG